MTQVSKATLVGSSILPGSIRSAGSRHLSTFLSRCDDPPGASGAERRVQTSSENQIEPRKMYNALGLHTRRNLEEK